MFRVLTDDYQKDERRIASWPGLSRKTVETEQGRIRFSAIRKNNNRKLQSFVAGDSLFMTVRSPTILSERIRHFNHILSICYKFRAALFPSRKAIALLRNETAA